MKYIRSIIVLFLLMSASCGQPEIISTNPPETTTEQGPQGDPGPPGVVLSILNIPVYGACVSLGGGLWVENEGTNIDVYNNYECDHGPPPYDALCNNVYEQETCWVGNMQFSITGTYGDMTLYILDFE
jgi:hypothetical protein